MTAPKRFAAPCLSLAPLLLISSLAAEQVSEIPNPKATAGAFVQDSAGVLGPEYSALIDQVCTRLESATSAEIAVVTVNNLAGLTIEDFAVDLFQRFGIGKQDQDNGILILFAQEDRKVRIEVGYGLEPVLNDALAGRILDEHAVPRFRDSEYGRGLYETTRAVAETVAADENVTLGLVDPETWPVESSAGPIGSVEALLSSGSSLLSSGAYSLTAFFLGVSLGLALLGWGILGLRIRFLKARAAKKKALGSTASVGSLLWLLSAMSMIAVGSMTDTFLVPLVGFLVVAGTYTAFHFLVKGRFTRYIADYQLKCPECGSRTKLVGEQADDAFLQAEEVAEERAGGMEYEFWKCPSCKNLTRLAVKLGDASKCPRCKRRTLKKSVTVLKAATESSRGRERVRHDCRNPNCGYEKVLERGTPRLSSSSDSSSGGSSSSSFGGGSSGGGGASRGW